MSSVAAQDVQCPEGQVVLQMDTANWLEEYTAFSVSVTSAAYLDDVFEVDQSWSTTTSTFEPLCVPVDKCPTVNIYQINDLQADHSPSNLSILYNTTTLSLSKPFRRDHWYVQVGASCAEVTCDDDQILVEIEAVTGPSTLYDWKVIDELTNEAVHACPTTPTPPTIPILATGPLTSGSGIDCVSRKMDVIAWWRVEWRIEIQESTIRRPFK